jgi:hypothetical protein
MKIWAIAAMCAALAVQPALAQKRPAKPAPQSYTSLTPAITKDAPPVSCQANKMFSCGATGCDVEDHPTGLPVQFELKGADAKGYLCTYTYCRSFTLMGWRGRPKGTGLIWSSASGSTPPNDKIPDYDFTLTMAEDWKSFTLASIGNGQVGGYSGQCKAPDQR